MSAPHRPAGIDSRHPSKLHLTDTPTSEMQQGLKHPADGPTEWFCLVCRARVTVSTRSSAEYGHQYGCPHASRDRERTPRALVRDRIDAVCTTCGCLDGHLEQCPEDGHV